MRSPVRLSPGSQASPATPPSSARHPNGRAPSRQFRRTSPRPRCSIVERTRFPWTAVWANEAGRSDGIGDGEEGFGRGGGGGDGGGGAERGTARAVECARENGDRAPTPEGRGARDGLAGDPGAGTRAGAVAADLPRGRDERLQAARQSGGGTRAEAGTGEGRR